MEFLSADLPQDIERLEMSGRYGEARRIIEKRIETSSGILKDRLEYELERIERLLKEYELGEEGLFDFLKANVEEFTRNEFDSLKDTGYFDYTMIDGIDKYQNRTGLSVIKAIPWVQARRKIHDPVREAFAADKARMIAEMISAGKIEVSIRLKTGLRLKPDAVPAGETVRVWLPIPRVGDQVTSVKILSTSQPITHISPADYPQRTVYFEKVSEGEDEFTVDYSYKTVLKYVSPDPDMAVVSSPVSHLGELAPQIVFSPHMRKLAEEIVGNEVNPLLKARKIYDFITTKLRYSFMRSYSTYISLTEFAASNLKGDCGVQALLFITLCRIVGVPAKWQSGLVASSQFVSPHDWVQFYVEPYGWLFADLSVGGSSWNAGNMEHWDFYFGNLDPLRMIANSEFQYPLEPAKDFYRTDPYDNQCGEVEWKKGNVYIDKFEPIRECIEITE